MLQPAGAEEPADVDDGGGAVAGDGVDDAGTSFRAIPPSMGTWTTPMVYGIAMEFHEDMWAIL